jgi:hypothetical protein
MNWTLSGDTKNVDNDDVIVVVGDGDDDDDFNEV